MVCAGHSPRRQAVPVRGRELARSSRQGERNAGLKQRASRDPAVEVRAASSRHSSPQCDRERIYGRTADVGGCVRWSERPHRPLRGRRARWRPRSHCGWFCLGARPGALPRRYPAVVSGPRSGERPPSHGRLAGRRLALVKAGLPGVVGLASTAPSSASAVRKRPSCSAYAAEAIIGRSDHRLGPLQGPGPRKVTHPRGVSGHRRAGAARLLRCSASGGTFGV